ncbi:serine/threonine protein kinase [Kitasatospora sp. DSM 101779]|uniref:serine/threonine protein kinase n=1 Tax=Kitasatospora sp. DSM 101779 TaxID=2853165 RepID=UPI0021D804A8|nr:serine/threonine protein kinase [Kitasatospora sp. DSM 101779]MCU7821273.1 serine/threonine protein kinase [Kitasatospora sp. DSM 101779]
MTGRPLLALREVADLESCLGRLGTVFAAFRAQDSGCHSYGVELPSGERWFVKAARTDAATAPVLRGRVLHRAVRHPAIVPQVHGFTADGRPAVVLPWCPGQVLYHPVAGRSGDRTDPDSPMARFRALPLPDVLAAVDVLLDAHLAVEAAGFVAVDLYDGSMLYDFAARNLRLVDLDEYRPGPFVLTEDRLPGSRRYLAPEQCTRGAVIDTRSTVFTLGRAARLLLDAGDEERAWRGGPARLGVIARATDPDPSRRHPTVAALAAAWRAAGSR